MADTSRQSARAPAPQYEPTGGAPAATGWAGWVVFAGVMLIMLGAFHVIEGLVALFEKSYFLVAPSGLVVNVNYTTWGWVHLIIGVVGGLAGLGLLTGNILARWIGVIVALVSSIVNLAFIAAYPIWSTIVIAIDLIVIYAIIVHGRELKSSDTI